MLLVMFLAWALPVYSIVHNQLSPSYESALSVAYGFVIGCIIHLLLLVLWLLIRRAKVQTLELVVLLASLGAMVVLTIMADSGALSRMGG